MKGFPFSPMRSCLKMTGPPSSSRMASAVTAMVGEKTIKATADAKMSNTLLMRYFIPEYLARST